MPLVSKNIYSEWEKLAMYHIKLKYIKLVKKKCSKQIKVEYNMIVGDCKKTIYVHETNVGMLNKNGGYSSKTK